MRNLVLHSALAGAIGICAGCVASEPTRTSPAPRPLTAVSIETQVDELVRASEPSAEHRALEPLVGRWSITLCDVDPSGRERDLATGDAQIEWVLDRRFLRWDAELLIAGAPRRTTGYLGFDKRGGLYELLMISNLATGMSVAQGKGDLARSGIQFQLEQADPRSGSLLRMQSRIASIDARHFVLDQLSDDGRVVRRTHYRRSS